MKTTKTRLAFLALAMLAAAGCEVDELDPPAVLDLVARSDLADPKGLAGIEVVVQGFGQFAAVDFAADTVRLGLVDHYPEKVVVDVRLHQGRVAQGRVEWKIEQARSRWELWIERSLYPKGIRRTWRARSAPRPAAPRPGSAVVSGGSPSRRTWPTSRTKRCGWCCGVAASPEQSAGSRGSGAMRRSLSRGIPSP